jgi:hypothetical protein
VSRAHVVEARQADCGHDGWVADCPVCEREHRAALDVAGIIEQYGPAVRRQRAEQHVPQHDDEQRRRLAALLVQAERMGWGRK